MTDDTRPAPQYGEYATPEEVALQRGTPAPPVPETRRPDPVPVRAVAPVERTRRGWDVPVTVGLLMLGFFVTVTSLSGYLDFRSTLAASFGQAGVTIQFGSDADIAGLVLLIAHCALWLLALGFSVMLLRRGRPAFWVPLVAGLLAFVTDVVVLAVLVFSNPAYSSILLNRP